LKQYRPRLTPLACVRRSTVTYAPREIWRRSISHEIEPKELFQQAQKFLQTGEAESAEAVCAGALDRYPEDANFLCLSARALVKLERFDEASARIERALSIFPEFERAYEVRGELLLAKGELPAAAEAFQQAVNLNPKRQQTRMKLGQVFMRLGRAEEARALKGEIMEFSQDNKDIAKAAELEKEEKLDEAERLYRQILTRDPDNVSAMRLWAGLGIKQKRYADAEVILKQAVEVAPGFSRAWTDLVTVQYEQEKFADSIKSAKRLIKLEPRVPNGHLLLASAFAAAGHHQDAVESFDNALEIAPDHVGALCGKGHVYRTIGDQDGAIAAFRRSIKANPLFAEPYWGLANLKTFRFEDSEVEDMLALVGDVRIPPEGQVELNNALGLEFDGRGEYDRAFEFIDRGNKLRREQEFYDRVENEETIDNLIEAFPQQFLEDKYGYGDPDPAPIFIVGLPRSGSTLIEQILSCHSKVQGTHELRDLAMTIRSMGKKCRSGARYPMYMPKVDKDGFKSAGGEYVERTRRHRESHPFFTDKNPNNFTHVGLLHLILPNAKIINARRHPLDSCFSSFKQLFAKGQPFTYDLIELGEYYLQYQRLMDHWHAVLPGKVLDVHYEEVVADLEGQVKRILEYCELEWEESCLRFHESSRPVKTASSEQVRLPIYSSSVNTWRHYETHLGALIEVLEPLLTELPESDRPASLGGSVVAGKE
jgi:tetratricopeptide (TPR) repeat protein